MNERLLAEIESLLIGHSPEMHRLRRDIVKLGGSSLPILVEGPTGSGKELVARGIHLASGRKGPLVAFNVCALSETMFEDALFGHVRGAFTGANADAAGYLAEADGGSILLDEINGLPLAAQAKLLRAIETGVFRPVGGRRDRQSNFRVIATSNADLWTEVIKGAFREDLFYRLRSLTIRVPRLAHRKSDIPYLVEHFLRAEHGDRVRVGSEGMSELSNHSWPGNVRELRSVVARMVLLAETGVVDAGVVKLALDSFGQPSSETSGYRRDDRGDLRALLGEFHGNAARIADHLGIHRATVYRRIRRYGLDASEGLDSSS